MTFQKEITFINPAFFDTETAQHIEKEVSKTATFNELSRTDKTQRKYQAMLMSIFKAKESGDLQIDYDVFTDIAEKAVETLLVTNETFTDVDKNQFLSDNGAIIDFGMWMLNEKITPFLPILIPRSSQIVKTTDQP